MTQVLAAIQHGLDPQNKPFSVTHPGLRPGEEVPGLGVVRGAGPAEQCRICTRLTEFRADFGGGWQIPICCRTCVDALAARIAADE